jgi:hypothetical protein
MSASKNRCKQGLDLNVLKEGDQDRAHKKKEMSDHSQLYDKRQYGRKPCGYGQAQKHDYGCRDRSCLRQRKKSENQNDPTHAIREGDNRKISPDNQREDHVLKKAGTKKLVMGHNDRGATYPLKFGMFLDLQR